MNIREPDVPALNTDFIVYLIPGCGYHWEGEGDYENYCSEDGFETAKQAEADAVAYLQSVDDSVS
ncbi:hypothetical protein BH23CYA1_BH23CYA1_13680 [soil metagenome]